MMTPTASSLARTLALPLSLLLGLAYAGCAKGGDTRPNGDSGLITRVDSGPPPMDSGVPRPDTGVPPTPDSGPPPTPDSGPPPVDSGPPPMPDSGPPAECRSAADCNDGLVCNGTERCEGGFCRPALSPFACDDGVSCTDDTCAEPGTCVYTPNNARCSAGQMCDRTAGCIASCSESPCRLVSPQCGCAAGQGCYLSGTTRSCMTAGTALEGNPCTADASCRAGMACINISRDGVTNVPQCMPFCENDTQCSSRGSNRGVCFYTLSDGMGGTLPGVQLCTNPCDPVTAAGCSASASCNVFQESGGAMRIFTDCTGPIGTGTQGSMCGDDSDCQRGFACAGTPSRCLHWCSSIGSTGGICTGGSRCTGFGTPLIVGGTEYGVCF